MSIEDEIRRYRYKTASKELQDPIPSSYHLHITCRKILWGLVQSINDTNDTTNDDTNNTNNDNDDISNDNIHSNEKNELSLPLSFESKRKRRKKKNKVIKHNHHHYHHSNNDFPFMDNVYMVMYDNDNKFYPAEVIGVGPSYPPLSTCIVKFISYGNTIEVKRSTGLVKVPIHYQSNIDNDIMNCIDFDRPNDVHEKYWDQRYRLLSKFDNGIQLDSESWFSITPEIIAKHIAQRCLEQFTKNNKNIDVILDCFCGCGGNSIAMADVCNDVIAIDIDPEKIIKIVHNAEIYNVSSHIKPLCNDVYNVLNELKERTGTIDLPNKIDLILLSPPWGGIDYAVGKFNIRDFPSGDGIELIEKALAVCSNIVCIFPRNSVNNQLKDLTKKFNTSCYAEDIHLYGKQKMKIYYFGDTLFL